MSTTSTPSTIPDRMKAWSYNHRGPVHKVLQLSSLPTPRLPQDSPNILVRITHASLTPSIAHLMPLLPFLRSSRPFIPELSFTGTIAAATPTTPPHLSTPGTRVFGIIPISAQLLHGAGALAEYVVTTPTSVGVCPADLAPEDAAGLDGNGQTALLMCRNANVRAGSRVFVNGATGGVGTVVVQVAKRVFGAAEVVATGSGEEGFALAKAMGADRVVDYRECGPGGITAWLAEEYGKGGDEGKFDVVLDCVGTQALFESSPEYLKEEGVFVSVGAMEGVFTTLFWNLPKNRWWPKMLGGTPRKFIFQQTPITPERREELVKLVQEGNLKRVVDSVFDMEDALKAYDRLLSQRAKGKVIVKIQDV
ncbi:Zinc-type alcohol dehydrogenase-like protein C16A3.02c [Lasiodiplodia hormozganensis]|uniref:Zinc-type alcohol dehydrogenase-like protein C16A3.02c n=1 Tax=Lasiodiplodia hormozganensis TaxID=869390 RepID=A0AA39XQE4_9PEZI|nr:Zinc-type alcohol dehydrogenase-like protein C16A3.02c [Lasiodiplodia hormozganensis]